VAALGGDARRFLDECDVVQFVVLARPRERRAGATASTPPRAQVGPGLAGPAAADPWSGSRRTRVLLVPDLDDPSDCLATALPAIALAVAGGGGTTLGVALPTGALEKPPAPVEELARCGLDLDLLLTEQPRTDAGWEALVRGATVMILTTSRPDLVSLATRLGVEVQDARRDPQLAGATPAPSRPQA
jgi:hypothetical protein